MWWRCRNRENGDKGGGEEGISGVRVNGGQVVGE